MNYFKASDVQKFFNANNLNGNFWNDIVEINNCSYIPYDAIEDAVGISWVGLMETKYPTLTVPTAFDLYSELRKIGLTHDQCDLVTDLIDVHYITR